MLSYDQGSILNTSRLALALGMFVYLRARTHALAGERARALQALERAFDSGFRTLWAVDLHPQPLMYLDPVAADPAFDSLRRSGEFQRWLGRIEVDVASQVARLDGATRASRSSPVGR